MGNRVQAVDDVTMNAQLSRTGHLSEEESAPALEGRPAGLSRSRTVEVSREPQSGNDGWDRVERRSGVDRRTGQDRRLDPTRHIPLGMPGERRSGKDRRNHPFYAERPTSPVSGPQTS